MALAPQFITSNSIKWQQIRYVFNIFAAAHCIKMITHAKKKKNDSKIMPPRILQIIHSRNAVKWRTAAVVGASLLFKNLFFVHLSEKLLSTIIIRHIPKLFFFCMNKHLLFNFKISTNVWRWREVLEKRGVNCVAKWGFPPPLSFVFAIWWVDKKNAQNHV